MTAADHANTVREALFRYAPVAADGRVTDAADLDALESLDALQAQAEWGGGLQSAADAEREQTIIGLMVRAEAAETEVAQLEARIAALHAANELLNREREAAEAERDRLRDALEEIAAVRLDETDDAEAVFAHRARRQMRGIARAALSARQEVK